MATIDVKTRGFQKATQQQGEFNTEARKTGPIYRATADEARRSGAIQRRVVRDLETDQERYNRKLREGKLALAGHARETELIARLENRLQQELRESSGELDRRRSKLHKQSEIARRAFDVGQVVRWGAALAGPSTAVSQLLQTLREVRQEQRESAEDLNQAAPTAGTLVQQAGGDKEKLAKLFAASDTILTSGGVRSRAEADQLAAALDASGELGNVRFFSRLNVIDSGSAIAKSIAVIREGFRGSDEVGTAPELFSKFVAASQPAPGVTGKDIAQGVASAAVSARAFALTDEEVTAAVSRISQLTGSGSRAGEQFNQLLISLKREGFADQFKGKGLGALIAEVDGFGFDEKGLTEFLKNDQAAKAFGVLQNQATLANRVASITVAQTSGLAERVLAQAENDPRTRTTIRRQAAEGRETLSRDRQARDTNLAQEYVSNRRARLRNAGESDLSIGLRDKATGFFRFIDGDEAIAQRSREIDTLDRLFREAEKQTRESEKQTKLMKERMGSVPVR